MKKLNIMPTDERLTPLSDPMPHVLQKQFPIINGTGGSFSVFGTIAAMKGEGMKMTRLACILMLLFICPMGAFATTLNISGDISGTINGEAFTATSAGSGDTITGQGSGTVTFSSLPYDFPVYASCNSFYSIICSVVCGEQNGAVNLYDLTSGNYSLTRTFSYPDFPSSSISLSGNVMTSGANLTYTENWSGTYNGPQDIVGITSYQHTLVPNGPGDVLTTGQATMADSSGNTYSILNTGEISGFSGELGSPESATIEWTTQELNGNVLTLAWQGSVTVVPEPSTLAFLGIGAVSLLAYAGRRRTRMA